MFNFKCYQIELHFVLELEDLLIKSQTTSARERVFLYLPIIISRDRDQSPPSLFLHASPIEDDLKVYFITN